MKEIKINEIFHSIQGEGANSGMPAVFIRLSGCNLQCSFCDTRHEDFTLFSVQDLLKEVALFPCKNIIWTGGEPTLQLTDEILSYFDGYYHCIETNGTCRIPGRIDYITLSPKGKIHESIKKVSEIRLAIKKGDIMPDVDAFPDAISHYISPIDVAKENIDYCIALLNQYPKWKISVQLHKLIGIQ